jgi:hypothetical protein
VFGSVEIRDAANLPASEFLHLFQTKRALPSKSSFMTPDLVSALQHLYSHDQNIYTNYLARRAKNGNRPVNVDMTGFDFSSVFSFNA